MSRYLRLPLSATDFVNVEGLEIDNVSDSNLARPTQPHLHGMTLRFRVPVGSEPPQIRPFGPGRLVFIYDPAEPQKIPPKPTPNDTDEDNYEDWPTKGWLQFRPRKSLYTKNILPNDLNMIYVWYGPVKLTRDFLFKSVSHRQGAGLRKDPIRNLKEDGSIEIITIEDTFLWSSFALSKFLYGEHALTLCVNNRSNPAVYDDDPETHDAVTKPMPQVYKDEEGNVELHIYVTQVCVKPQDGTHKELDKLFYSYGPEPGTLQEHWFSLVDDARFETLQDEENDEEKRFTLRPRRVPFHPMYSPIPVGLMLYELRNQFVDLPPTNSAAHQELFPSQSPKYTKLQFTRTWQKIPNWSTYFPKQNVRITSQDALGATSDNPTLILEGKLPITGTVYLQQTDPPFRHVQISLPSELPRPGTYLKGEYEGSGDAPWQKCGDTEPLNYNLSELSEPHVVVRRPFGEEMLREKPLEVRGGGALCTYSSLRRFLLAFIDHRITGGRILTSLEILPNNPQLDQASRKLLDAASPGLAADVAETLPLNNLISIFRNAPRRDKEAIARVVATHRPIMEKLFPKTEPESKPWSQGRIAFHLWHDAVGVMAKFKSRFPSQYIGMGAPGAAIYLGLIKDFAFSSRRPNYADFPSRPFSDADYAAMMTNRMRYTELGPGALLKWHTRISDFENITMPQFSTPSNMEKWLREDDKPKLDGVGHSLIFASHERIGDEVTGIYVVDYFIKEDPNGFRHCPLIDGLLWWALAKPRVWMAADWTEE